MSPKFARYLVAVLCSTAPLEIAAQTASIGVEIASSYGVRSDVVYHAASGRELTLDLYVPQASDGPVPVLVYYHGGGWVVRDRHSASLQILPYLERGFAVANVSYRLAETALAPAAGGHGGFSLDQDAHNYSRIWEFLKEHGVIR